MWGGYSGVQPQEAPPIAWEYVEQHKYLGCMVMNACLHVLKTSNSSSFFLGLYDHFHTLTNHSIGEFTQHAGAMSGRTLKSNPHFQHFQQSDL